MSKNKRFKLKHGIPDPNSLEFKLLKDEWYKVLKDSGFEDIEGYQDKSGLLTASDQCVFHPDKKHIFVDPNVIQSVAWRSIPQAENQFNYFRLIRIFLSHGHFLSKIDRKVLENHEKSISYSQTVKQFANSKYFPTISNESVSHIMRRAKFQMLGFHLTHPEGEYRGSEIVPFLLHPEYNPDLKNRRGINKYRKTDQNPTPQGLYDILLWALKNSVHRYRPEQKARHHGRLMRRWFRDLER